jgi:hypothetical protein
LFQACYGLSAFSGLEWTIKPVTEEKWAARRSKNDLIEARFDDGTTWKSRWN